MPCAPLLLDSITDLKPEHAGLIAVCGSHGGAYPAALASHGGLKAVVLNDAGRGYQDAGVAGVLALAGVGMAAAAADCFSCLIGSAEDSYAHGTISVSNPLAEQLGVAAGMAVREAAGRLVDAPMPNRQLAPGEEARSDVTLPTHGLTVSLLDSASLVRPMDAGKVVVTGSHGGLIGGNPARALKADCRIAVFNDAGIGKNAIGISRLPALDGRGIAAVTVSHDSACIGDARSALETGVISAANETAVALGATKGQALTAWLDSVSPQR